MVSYQPTLKVTLQAWNVSSNLNKHIQHKILLQIFLCNVVIFKLECLINLKVTLLWHDLVFFQCRIRVLNLKLLGVLESNSRRFKLWKNRVSMPKPCVYSQEVTRIIPTRGRFPTRNKLDANVHASSPDCTVHH